MTNEDSLKKPGGFSAEKRSFMNELIAAFHHLKWITEKIESNFSQRCTEIGQEAMTRKKAVRYRRGKKKSQGQWLQTRREAQRDCTISVLGHFNIQLDRAMRSLIYLCS